MENLILNSLEIQAYRAFSHLLIQNFGRVNLIVGKNNVGKSSLLEALWLYTQRGRPTVLIDLLKSRDELSRIMRFSEESNVNPKDRMWDIKYLFCGREDVRNNFKPIKVGPIDSPDNTLTIDIKWYVSETDEQGVEQRRLVDDPSQRVEAEPYIVIQEGTKGRRLIRLERLIGQRFATATNAEIESISCRYIKANGLSPLDVAQLWDKIALTDMEESVVAALHIIAPDINRLSFIGNEERGSNRIPVARIKGFSDPISLRSMGEGMGRILGIALALVNARDGVLLVDEIESGLHYTVQADMWRLIFRVAHRLNVQVFATTHSWDCIEAFQKAAVEDVADEGLLIRLENKGTEIGATLFNERKLSIATRDQIEVR
jgi:predicted ATP-dependent endonuclease of OLD family